ncbi:MAG: hypothetical protein EOQ41_03050 [Mesorhizobium sp.]|uniref:hypothetical protein n=1 Tax=Mesorhizobium sp. TaxID=1871066 RepID=UPI000FE72C52|nr:hypothetical protein [Mesorhizobium sp.]RWB35803.1 MAG: hypothetical protein EOQ41_03050 [Mesorhizobium sp.]
MSRRRALPSTENALATSFLDVLSNGLGAGILLMVLIAAVPIERPVASVPNAPFIRGSWTARNDEGAVLYLRMEPPGAGRSFVVDLRDLDLAATIDLNCSWPGVSAAGRVQIYGFSAAGRAAATVNTQAKDRSFILWIGEPVPGKWTVGVVYANRSDSGRRRPKAIDVTQTIETREIPRAQTEGKLEFGEPQSGTFEIPSYGISDAADARKSCKWL